VGAVATCLVAGLLIGVTRAYSNGEDVGTRSVDLSVVVNDAQNRVLAADARAAELQAQVDRAAAGDMSPQVAAARAKVSRAGVSVLKAREAALGPLRYRYEAKSGLVRKLDKRAYRSLLAKCPRLALGTVGGF